MNIISAVSFNSIFFGNEFRFYFILMANFMFYSLKLLCLRGLLSKNELPKIEAIEGYFL